MPRRDCKIKTKEEYVMTDLIFFCNALLIPLEVKKKLEVRVN